MSPAPPRVASTPAGPCPGDDIIPNPEMLYNHCIAINAPPSEIFPWVLQLGKGRAGWYTPTSWERLLPRRAHASRSISPDWTNLKVGDRVEDYGMNHEEDFFDVVEIVKDHALVYKSERYGTIFTWAILVEELDGTAGREKREGWCVLRLRFRGRIHKGGWQRKMLVWGGSFMDWITTWPMLRGLKERAEKSHQS